MFLGSVERPCYYCAEALPGEGFVSYNAESDIDLWITQSQSVCYRKDDNLLEMFEDARQLEGQLRHYKCGKPENSGVKIEFLTYNSQWSGSDMFGFWLACDSFAFGKLPYLTDFIAA